MGAKLIKKIKQVNLFYDTKIKNTAYDIYMCIEEAQIKRKRTFSNEKIFFIHIT